MTPYKMWFRRPSSEKNQETPHNGELLLQHFTEGRRRRDGGGGDCGEEGGEARSRITSSALYMIFRHTSFFFPPVSNLTLSR